MDVAHQNQLIEKLNEVGRRLLEPPSATPALIILLDEVEFLLTKVRQAPPQPVQEALLIPMKALIGDQFFRHSDPNVRVTFISCLSEVMRISAPVPPYDDDKMKRNASPKHPRSVLIAMEKIMSVIIQESDSVSLELLNALLSSIRKENQTASPASWELGAKIIEECADKLKPFILETVSSMGCCLEDYAPILSSICKSETDIVKNVNHDSSNHQLVHGESSAGMSDPAECVQALMAVDRCRNAPASRAGKAFGSESGGTASTSRKPTSQNAGEGLENGVDRAKASRGSPCSQLKKSSDPSGSEDEEFSPKEEEVTDLQREKAHPITSLDDISKKEGRLMKNGISGGSGGKVLNQKKDVSGVRGSSGTKFLNPQKDHSLGSGNKSKVGLSRKDKTQSNHASKNQRKRASSDDDVIETPHGRKSYKHDLVGSRIKVWWPLDRRFYEGTITSFDDSTRKHKVDYDDGDEEVLNLGKECWEFLGDEIVPDIGLLFDKHTAKPPSNMPKQKGLTDGEKKTSETYSDEKSI